MSKNKVDPSIIEYAYKNLNPDLLPKNNPEYEKMISGNLYNAMDKELLFKRCISNEYVEQYSSIKLLDIIKESASGTTDDQTSLTLENSLHSTELLRQRRNDILKKHIFGSIGEDAFVEPPFFVDYGCNIKVGDNFYCNFNCVFLDCSLIIIGNDVMLGPGVNLLTASHPLDAKGRCHQGKELAYAIEIGDECWLGANVVVCPGVKIGKRCVVAAGSVVTKSFGDGLLLGGVPAKVIREIVEPDDPEIAKVKST